MKDVIPTKQGFLITYTDLDTGEVRNSMCGLTDSELRVFLERGVDAVWKYRGGARAGVPGRAKTVFYVWSDACPTGQKALGISEVASVLGVTVAAVDKAKTRRQLYVDQGDRWEVPADMPIYRMRGGCFIEEAHRETFLDEHYRD